MNYYIFFYLLSIIFLEIKIPKYKGIHLSSVLHSMITGCLSNYLLINDSNVFLNIYNYEVDEVNGLYKVIPYYSFIFSFIDIFYSIKMNSKIFIFHGFMMFFSILFGIYLNKNHYLSVGLILESSTIFYNFVSLDNNLINFLFGISFLFYRNIVFFLISINYLNFYYQNKLYLNVSDNLILASLFSFNCLNFYWGKKLIKKIVKIKKNL